MKEWKASELDIRCSDACTRAGLTALLFSALAIALLIPVAKWDPFDALGKYISLRLTLKNVVEDLDNEPCWDMVKSQQPNSQVRDTWRLSQLLEVKCTWTTPSIEAQAPMPPVPSPVPSISQEATALGPPAAATAPTLRLTYKYGLWQMEIAADTLTALGDGKLLMRARAASNHFNYSIGRWAHLRDRLMSKNGAFPFSPTSGQESKQEDDSLFYTRENLLKYLTLANIRRLATSELPSIDEIDLPLAQRKGFTWSPTAPPFNIEAATMFVELVLIFALAHFWFFYREARRSETFLAPGTLFGVLQRTRIARVTFFFLMLTPAIAASLLAYASFPKVPLNSFLAAFVVWFVCLIRRESRL